MKIGVEIAVVAVAFCALVASAEGPLVVPSESGQLIYSKAGNGDCVPDFSFCGYEASEEVVPQVATRLIVQPSGTDDTLAIQSALDELAQQALENHNVHVQSADNQSADNQQWRGALMLGPGIFYVSSTLYLRGDHVVLRGSVDGSGNMATEIRTVGKSRRPALVVGSDADDPQRKSRTRDDRRQTPATNIAAKIMGYVPIGSDRVTIDNPEQFTVGCSVEIVHPSTQTWIEAVGMRAFPDDDGKGSWLNWKAGTLDQTWMRSIVAIENHTLILDAPLTASIDPSLTQGRVVVVPAQSHHHLGVEDLKILSHVDPSVHAMDEEHAWDAIRFCDVQDGWARNISFQHFAGSAVQVGPNSRRITVSDCRSVSPVSELAGWRRHTFFCLGQQALFLRCHAEDGRHDFSTGALTAGPNAFVYCSANNASNFSGPIGNWSTGVLYDNVQIDGHGLQLTNRETELAGSGWVAANCVMWNCVAPEIVCRRPPTAFNVAVGIWGEVKGNGTWRSLNEFVSPDSLFAAQLRERRGENLSKRILGERTPGMSELIKAEHTKAMRYEPTSRSKTSVVPGVADHESADTHKLAVTNGWLTIGDRLAIGKRKTLSWWRGSLLPARAEEFGSGLTRYVPGLDGSLFTNSIDDLVSDMRRRGAIALEHHWGLWYDRRRDDHQMVRRMNADAWPPFYEQPWARSGQGQAWDGLSKYDLSRFNTWYFDRLSQFAATADQQGLILIQQMYFQHNLLEAGAHWADFPWRPANCIQDVGFTEPPVYENRKRVFMADDFYDVTHPVRREMHTLYIRHCLNTLGKFNNVVFSLGEEYTGPVHFLKFWLDTIRLWSQENNRDVLVMLSACRDVQEQVLASEQYEELVDIIDVKYWWYTSDGSLFDPAGGQSLAPRQQLRNWTRSKSRSTESICRSVYELKSRFPEKAVTCSIPTDSPWMLLAAGCSLTELPEGTDVSLLRDLVELRPMDRDAEMELAVVDGSQNVQGVSWMARSSSVNGVGSQLVVAPQRLAVRLRPEAKGSLKYVDAQTGRIHAEANMGLESYSSKNPYLLWIDSAR